MTQQTFQYPLDYVKEEKKPSVGIKKRGWQKKARKYLKDLMIN